MRRDVQELLDLTLEKQDRRPGVRFGLLIHEVLVETCCPFKERKEVASAISDAAKERRKMKRESQQEARGGQPKLTTKQACHVARSAEQIQAHVMQVVREQTKKLASPLRPVQLSLNF